MSGFDIEVPKEDRYDRYFSVFDFEAMVVKTPSKTVDKVKFCMQRILTQAKFNVVLHELKQNVYF